MFISPSAPHLSVLQNKLTATFSGGGGGGGNETQLQMAYFEDTLTLPVGIFDDQ